MFALGSYVSKRSALVQEVHGLTPNGAKPFLEAMMK